MKGILKTLFILTLCFPLLANAEITSETQARGAEYRDDNNILTKCMEDYNGNIGYNKDTKVLTAKRVGKNESFYYLDVVGVKCESAKNKHYLRVESKEKSAVCENGNNNPYFKLINSGLENPAMGAQSLAANADCNPEELESDGEGFYAYGTRIFQVQCNLVANGDDEPIPYKEEEPSTTPSSNPTSSTTSSSVTTVKSPDTGVEDYFLTLGIVASILIITFYFIEKKNVFKRI